MIDAFLNSQLPCATFLVGVNKEDVAFEVVVQGWCGDERIRVLLFSIYFNKFHSRKFHLMSFYRLSRGDDELFEALLPLSCTNLISKKPCWRLVGFFGCFV